MQKFMQLKDYLLELSFLALLIRIICVGAGIGEALAVISLVLSMAYNKWLTKSKVEQEEQLTNSINSMKEDYDKKFESIFAKMNSQVMDKELRKPQNEQKATGPRRLF